MRIWPYFGQEILGERYCSYKWAEFTSAEAFGASKEIGLDNKDGVWEVKHKFQDTVLSLGGGIAPMDVFAQLQGREPTPDALLRHTGLS